MARFLLLYITLISSAASAQVISGSIVVSNFTKDQIIVAADSRGITNDTGKPDDSYCKISAFRNQFIFASVGGSRLTNSNLSDNIRSWDNTDLARDAIEGMANNPNIDSMEALTTDWGRSVAERWIPLCGAHREICANLASHGNGILTEGTFFRVKDLSVAGAEISFDLSAPRDSVRCGIFQADTTKCWSCGQSKGQRICVAGEHFDIAEEYCRTRKPGKRLRIRTHLQGTVSDNTRLPVKLVEMTIDAYSKNDGSVGGSVDTATITRGKGIAWNSLKKECVKHDQ